MKRQIKKQILIYAGKVNTQYVTAAQQELFGRFAAFGANLGGSSKYSSEALEE